MKYIAHRNGVWKGPFGFRESEIKGYRYVVDKYATTLHGIECDIRQTRDRQLVVCHDSILRTNTGIHRCVQECLYRDICDKVILFEDLFREGLTFPDSLVWYIELKHTGFEKDFFQILDRYYQQKSSLQICILSFDSWILERCFREYKNTRIQRLRFGLNIEEFSSTPFITENILSVYNWEWKTYLWNYRKIHRQFPNQEHNVFTINSSVLEWIFRTFHLCHAIFTDSIPSFLP